MKLMKVAICIVLLGVLCIIGYCGYASAPAFLKLFSPFEGFWQNAETSPKDVSVALSGVKEDIQIIFDDRLVPHIYAQNLDDALFAQGYLHAKYRLFQCDLSVRAIQGRLSEIIGERTIEIDREKINKSYRKSIKETDEHWRNDVENYALLNSYCSGFNAFLKTLKPKDYPIEFKLLSYDPTEWSGHQVVSVMKSMQDILASGHNDVAATNTKEHIGQEDFDLYFPERNPKQIPIIPNEGQWQNNAVSKEKHEIREDLGTYEIPFLNRHDPFIGSNNWVISPRKSTSNNAILCNDPHLNLTLPSIWYEIEIHTPSISAHGVSIPGAPGIIIGFNNKIAWGVTNVGHDITDFYPVKWTNAEKTEYLVGEKNQKISSIVSEIEVKKGKTVLDTTDYTIWGPIFYGDENEDRDLAMRWVGNEIFEKTEMPFFLNLMQAESRDAFDQALEHFAVPAQNIVYADVQGNIGLDVEGQLPLREHGQGRFIASPSDDFSELSYIPKEENPASFNPQQGYLASANQASTDTSYPYYYLGNFDDYRGRLVNMFLRSKEKHSLEDLMSYQNSDYSLYAEEALSGLLSLIESTELIHQAEIERLRYWDYHFTMESEISILFELWYQEFYQLLWDEFASGSQLKPEDWRTISIMSTPSDKIFDVKATEQLENGIDVATKSFYIALTAYNKLKEEGVENWTQYKSFDLKHLSRIPAFGRMDLETSGHQYALNSVRRTVGPSWKMLVEMTENPKAHVVYPGGQSGNPGSKYYDDMLQTWLNGEYYEVELKKDPWQAENILYTMSMTAR